MHRFSKVRSRHRGKHFERVARVHLESQGLKFLTANYQCKHGEIDLLMCVPHEIVVFVEVKYRQSPRFGHALEMVSYSKQRKIRLTASFFLLQNPQWQKYACRFDVVGIQPGDSTESPEIHWIENAFN